MKEFNFVENAQKDTQETANIQETNRQTAQENAKTLGGVISNSQQNAKPPYKKSSCRIYVRSKHRWFPVSKEYFETYMRDIGAFKKKQYRQGLCKCPGTKEYMCDCDCLTCPFYKKGAFLSLDAPIVDDEGNEETLMEQLMDESTLSPEEELLVKDEYGSLYRAIDQLCEEDRILTLMTLKGKLQIEIADVLGLKRQSNVRYRKQRVIEELKAILMCQYGFIKS